MFREAPARAFSIKQLLPIRRRQREKFDLLLTLVRRSLEARYKGSILGNLWSLLNPIAQLLIYTYVFSVVLKVKLDLQGVTINENLTFGLWLFAGLLPWIAFSSGLVQASTSVIAQPNLVKKVVFPLSLLPLVPILSSFVESTVGIVVLIAMVALFSGSIHYTLIFLPVVWCTQLLLTIGMGYWASGLTVFLRDVPQTLSIIMNIWMYGTPIIYPASAIPESWRPWIFWLNPMTSIVENYRDTVLTGRLEHTVELMAASFVSLAIFITGFLCYKRMRPAFADVL